MWIQQVNYVDSWLLSSLIYLPISPVAADKLIISTYLALGRGREKEQEEKREWKLLEPQWILSFLLTNNIES